MQIGCMLKAHQGKGCVRHIFPNRFSPPAAVFLFCLLPFLCLVSAYFLPLPPPLLALCGPGAGEEAPSVRLGSLWAPRGHERPRPREGARHGPQPRRRGGGAPPGASVGV